MNTCKDERSIPLLVICSCNSCDNVQCSKDLNHSVFDLLLIQTNTEQQMTIKEKTETPAVWNLILLYDADSSILRQSCFLFLYKEISVLSSGQLNGGIVKFTHGFPLLRFFLAVTSLWILKGRKSTAVLALQVKPKPSGIIFCCSHHSSAQRYSMIPCYHHSFSLP